MDINQAKESESEQKGYVIEKRGRGFRVVTNGQNGANQFQVDAIQAEQKPGEPIWVTVANMFKKFGRK